MMSKLSPICLAASLLIAAASAGASGVAAQGEASAPPADASLVATGSKLFQLNCAECHTLSEDGEQVAGPNLWKLVGSKAGTKPDFPYSDALKSSTIVWTPQTLDKWLTSPSALVPDNMMGFVGMPKMEDRQAVIAFLQKRTSE
jgi:cytochrome c